MCGHRPRFVESNRGRALYADVHKEKRALDKFAKLEHLMPIDPSRTSPIRRLTRVEQLTLNTWRWAAIKVGQADPRQAFFEHAALHAVLAALRDVADPLSLFTCHAEAHAEFQLILSVMPDDRPPSVAHDILDTAFLMRWTELLADCSAPEELPPLSARNPGPSRTAE
jgi:hypothetical protein